jgi:hypothetical protein
MTGTVRAVREAARVVGEEVGARRGRFFALAVLAFASYAATILCLVALRAGAVPNYIRGFDVIGGLLDVLRLSMPLSERYELLAEQPLLEVGYFHPLMGTVEGAYTVTLHALLNLVVLSVLVAAYVLVMARARRTRRLTGRTLAGLGLAGGGSVTGVVTAGAATVACCSGPAASAALTVLGVGAGVATYVTVHDRVLGVLGLLLMLLSLGAATRVARGGCGVTR